ncbi:DHH family phosphoesterase [Desulfococcaceae bacterium HSG8]|nr:DHH family phosphoesterase [Desulfococcaceae bacterium HSG8]
MKPSTSRKLRRFYERFSGNNQVLISINADPDAIASAMAVKRLLWRKVSGVTISNINIIKRPDNIAMIRLLGLDIVHTDEINKEKFDRFVIVDSQPNHHEKFGRFQFDVIIDHHPETDAEALFSDIRPDYGATASIMTEYIRAAKIKPSAKLATALFHAIKTDTHDFKRQALLEDIRAFQFLFRHANLHLARKIEQADLRLDFLKYFQIAFENMRMRKGRAFVHLGPVVNPDICVLIADFFMRICSVKWSIVSGIYEDKLILVFRNDGLRKDAGKVAKSGFGHLGSAGGHKSMARAEIPVPGLKKIVNYEDDRGLLQWIIDRVEKKQKDPNIVFKKEILGLKS